MSTIPEAEHEDIRQQRRKCAFGSQNLSEFLFVSQKLFNTVEEAEDYWDAYMEWDAEQDNKGGGN